jgi:hypothetical protein
MVRLYEIAPVMASKRCMMRAPDAFNAAAAVQFEVELALQRFVDGLDELAGGFEQSSPA